MQPLAIFALAFAVRMVYMLQVRHSVFWSWPLVDAKTYDDIAQDLVKTSWLGPLPNEQTPYAPYYQPPLYPFFLAVIYAAFGHLYLAAKVIQFAMGSVTCVLAYFIGQRFFGWRVAIAAGIATALTASQIFYDGQLLPAALTTFLNMLIIVLAAKQTDSPARWRWPVIGLLLGLSATTRPDILLFAPALVSWMWLERERVLPTGASKWTAALCLCALLPIGLVSARNAVVGKDFNLISWNGGINFFIGNYPDLDKTLSVRPGLRWQELMAQPKLKAGITRPSQMSAFFYTNAARLAIKHPKRTASNLVRKFIWVWRGPEIRRNEDDYYLTQVSSLYRTLLWRRGNFGFPFGIIAPLALLGMLTHVRRRRELMLLYWYVITQTAMLVAFFPCSRYRAPMVPVLIVFAAAAVFEMVDLTRRRQAYDLALRVCALVGLAFFCTLAPPSFEGTPKQIESDTLQLIGAAYQEQGNISNAIAYFEKAIALTPNDPDTHKLLMGAAYLNGDYAKAEEHCKAVIRGIPELEEAYIWLAIIYRAQGKIEQAEKIDRSLRVDTSNREMKLGRPQ